MTTGAPSASGSRPRPTPAWDSSRPGRRGQSLLVTLAALALIPSVTATVLRLVPPKDDATALVASFIPYGLLGYLLALVLVVSALVRARRRRALSVIAIAVALLIALHLSWVVPFFVSDHRPATTPTFTLLSLNLYNGQADPAQIVAVAEQADVVVLVETTPDALRALGPYGWDQRYPYAVGGIKADFSDTAIYSRFPVNGGALLPDSSFQQWATTLQVPRVGTIHLVAAHPCNPFCGSNRWTSEHDQLRRSVRPFLDGPVIVAGDFNAVDDHGPMRDLSAGGLESGTDIAGAGWLPTYPANWTIPPLLPIDHVLVNRRLTVTAIHAFTVAGTDHRGLLTTIAGAG